MARSSTKKSARRSLLALIVVILGLGGLVGGLTVWGGGSTTPRLGLDLEGGTELVLQPVLVGTEKINEGQVNRAVDIIRQRIDANGVSEAEIATQGGQNIVVSIPGTPSPEQLDAIRKPSQLRFRAVYVQALDTNATQVNPGGTATGTPTPSGAATTPATGTPSAPVTGTPSTSA
ncbi:MAG: protein translocase subunit SecD, partial [Dermatophilaceae bacterium]|nr:protein translocase subunit SecD [Dermatophilaceae bacterium]